MVKIRVTCGGCGIEYIDEHGNARHTLKTSEDGPFLCDTEQARRLIRLGVAAYITSREPDRTETDGSGSEPMKNPDTRTGYFSSDDLEKWEINNLRKLATDMGIRPKGKKKADYIDAIVSAEIEIRNNEAEGDDEIDGDDELPDLEAAEPE